MSFNQDRVVTASIGLRIRTIEEIHRRAGEHGHSFSREGRDLIEWALQHNVPAAPETPQEPPQAPEVSSAEETDATQ